MKSRRPRSDHDTDVPASQRPSPVPGKKPRVPNVSEAASSQSTPDWSSLDQGTALPSTVRTAMEGQFGEDFASVRIHKDDGEAERVDARAVAQGENIHFADGEWNAASTTGRFLLAHELTHVVQQRRGSTSKQAKAVNTVPDNAAKNLSDSSLEGEADRIGARVARGKSVVGQVYGRASGNVAQRFGAKEHMSLGDAGSRKQDGSAQRVALAEDGYSISFGEMTAMAADHFASISQMRRFAANAGKGASTREEIEYVRMVWIHKRKDDATVNSFSKSARSAADERYYMLAGDNRSHFLNPRVGDKDRPMAEQATRHRRPFPWLKEVPASAASGYRLHHAQAIQEAVAAGQGQGSLSQALAVEGFGSHYLTDAFSSGHIRAERVSISEYWNERVPMFNYNAKGYIAQKMVEELQRTAYSWKGFAIRKDILYHGVLNQEGALETVTKALDAKGSFSFGDVVSLAVHDAENKPGLQATIEVDGQQQQVELFGDGHLALGDTRHVATNAVAAGVSEVRKAFAAGKSGQSADDVAKGFMKNELFAPERMLPKALPSAQQKPEQRSIKWDYPDVETLLGDSKFLAALAIFAEEKAGDLEDALNDFSDEQKTAMKNQIIDPLVSDPERVLREIINWTPNTGGGLWGHNQDDNAMDYYAQVKKTPGGLGSLTLDQKRKLVKNLVDGATVGDEEDAIVGMLKANRSDARVIIKEIGWKKLESDVDDWFGAAFAEAFPKREYGR